MRRLRRSTVEQILRRYLTAVTEEEHEKVARLDRQVSGVEFYLSQEQCDALNAARESLEHHRWEEDRVRMQVVPVPPHPAMDDSYLIDPVSL